MENLYQNEADNVQNENINNDSDNQQNQETNDNLILGKFKSVDDLTNAYKKMESQQGLQSKELGDLRKKSQIMDEFFKQRQEEDDRFNKMAEYIKNVVPKYDKEEYFQNAEFENLYKEALQALGPDLDTDKFISLLDKYVLARISMHQKAQSAIDENENAISQMQFSDSPAKTESKKIPKLDTLDPKEIDEYIAKYI